MNALYVLYIMHVVHTVEALSTFCEVSKMSVKHAIRLDFHRH
jgi:hypothetical protein